MRILVATNNASKLARVRELLTGTGVECCSPRDLGIETVEVEEGSDIVQNAERKARAYLGKTDLPVLGMDSALVIPGEDLDPAKVRRNALVDRDESSMTRDEIAHAVVDFYRGIVQRRGAPVPTYWDDAFALVLPDGTVRHERAKRQSVLTADVVGTLDPFFPLRSMCIVQPSGKYVTEQTPEEELLELRPCADAVRRLLEIP